MKRTSKIIMLIFICIIILMLEYKIFLILMYKGINNTTKNLEKIVKISDTEDTAIYKNNNIDKKIYISKTNNSRIFKTNLEKFGYNNKENYNNNTYFLDNYDKTIISINDSTNFYKLCNMLTSKSIAEETNILALSMMINPNKLLKKYNINSNADLFNAMVDGIGNDVNIFNSNDYIRYSYFIRFITIASFPNTSNANKLYTISGDYDGYFFEYPINKDSKGGYQAYICTDKNSFDCIDIIFLNKEYFTYDKVIELISRIEVIEE